MRAVTSVQRSRSFMVSEAEREFCYEEEREADGADEEEERAGIDFFALDRLFACFLAFVFTREST